MPPKPRIWILSAAALFLLIWGLRLASLSPAFHPDDSPETALAAHALGIQHPPGYPLPTLAGRLAWLAFPGSPAFRLSLLAALGSALVPLLLAGLALQAGLLTERGWRELAWVAALALAAAAGSQLWFQGLSAKGGHYTLNLALGLAAYILFLRGWLKLGFLLVGLGLAGHYMSFVLLMPAMLWWAWRQGLRRRWQAALWALPGLSLYLYLPLRAALQPALNWGDPQTWERFWQVFSRAQYTPGAFVHGAANTLRLARHFAGLAGAELPWPALGLAGLGLWSLWQGRVLRPLLLTLALHLVMVVLYNRPPDDAPWVANAFFLPELVLLWLAALAGALRLMRSLPPARTAALAAAALLASGGLAAARLRAADLSQDHLAYDYAHDLLQGLPRHSLLMASGGNDAFAIWYLQHVEAKRRDVVLYDVPLTAPWYLDQLRRQAPDLRFEGATKDEVVKRLLDAPPPARPLYYSAHNPGDRGIPYGLACRVPAAGAQVPLSGPALLGPWQALRRRWQADRRTRLDGNRAELAGYYPAAARALAEFAQRARVAPLEALARQLEAGLALPGGGG